MKKRNQIGPMRWEHSSAHGRYGNGIWELGDVLEGELDPVLVFLLLALEEEAPYEET